MTGHRFIPAWAGNTRTPVSGCRRQPVHPRVGGEHAPRITFSAQLTGSSPRGRGTRNARLTREVAASVHPRVGGEHAMPRATWASDSGSSPRGRGTRSARLRGSSRARFIPAWAGNTACCQYGSGHVPVHPRVGGEHIPGPGSLDEFSGSSPRGRGTPRHGQRLGRDRRFIPAWAGNTSAMPPARTPRSVHPRVGGEHGADIGHPVVNTGSSPRGRGTRRLHVHAGDRLRFIPAWAGNTSAASRWSSRRPVHPRVGGEHQSRTVLSSPADGSSPRGRGTLRSTQIPRRSLRFIPAWAGNTTNSFRFSTWASVHPRVGGEHGRVPHVSLF